MPLGKNIKKNFHELYADNKKSGKEKGVNGKVRSKAQIVAIALSAAKKNKKKEGYNFAKAETKLGVVNS